MINSRCLTNLFWFITFRWPQIGTLNLLTIDFSSFTEFFGSCLSSSTWLLKCRQRTAFSLPRFQEQRTKDVCRLNYKGWDTILKVPLHERKSIFSSLYKKLLPLTPHLSSVDLNLYSEFILCPGTHPTLVAHGLWCQFASPCGALALSIYRVTDRSKEEANGLKEVRWIHHSGTECPAEHTEPQLTQLPATLTLILLDNVSPLPMQCTFL